MFHGSHCSHWPAGLVYCVYRPVILMSAGGLFNCVLTVNVMLFAAGVVCRLRGAEPADRSVAERRR